MRSEQGVAADNNEPPPAPRDPSSYSMPELVDLLGGASSELQQVAAQRLRTLLSRTAPPPPIQSAIEAGAVAALLALLRPAVDALPKLQFEAAWALTNISSGTHEDTAAVIAAGGVPAFVRLLSASASVDVREQCVWALGNIAGDSNSARDSVLGGGALAPLLTMLTGNDLPLSARRNGAWALSNFCRFHKKAGGQRTQLAAVAPSLPLLAQQLLYSSDAEVLTDACWALSYVSDGPDENISAVQGSGALPRLAVLLSHVDAKVVTPALRAVGNMLTGGTEQTQATIDAGVLPAIRDLLQHSEKAIRKEACWALSNVAAGTPAQIQCLFEARAIAPILGLATGPHTDVRKEALWTIANACDAPSAQLVELMQEGCLPPLLAALACPALSGAWACVGAVLEGLGKLHSRGMLHRHVRYLAAAGLRDKLVLLGTGAGAAHLSAGARDGAGALLRFLDEAALHHNDEELPEAAG